MKEKLKGRLSKFFSLETGKKVGLGGLAGGMGLIILSQLGWISAIPTAFAIGMSTIITVGLIGAIAVAGIGAIAAIGHGLRYLFSKSYREHCKEAKQERKNARNKTNAKENEQEKTNNQKKTNTQNNGNGKANTTNKKTTSKKKSKAVDNGEVTATNSETTSPVKGKDQANKPKDTSNANKAETTSEKGTSSTEAVYDNMKGKAVGASLNSEDVSFLQQLFAGQLAGILDMKDAKAVFTEEENVEIAKISEIGDKLGVTDEMIEKFRAASEPQETQISAPAETGAENPASIEETPVEVQGAPNKTGSKKNI